MKVMRDLVLIEADKPKDSSSGGILLAEDWKNRPPWGTVLEVGPEVAEVEKGDRVLFGRFQAVVLDGEQRLVQERYIWAKEVE